MGCEINPVCVCVCACVVYVVCVLCVCVFCVCLCVCMLCMCVCGHDKQHFLIPYVGRGLYDARHSGGVEGVCLWHLTSNRETNTRLEYYIHKGGWLVNTTASQWNH